MSHLNFFDKKKMYLITCYVQSHDVRFVFTLCLSKMRFIKLVLKGEEIGGVQVVICFFLSHFFDDTVSFQFSCKSDSKAKKGRKSHFHNFCKKKGVLEKQVSQF